MSNNVSVIFNYSSISIDNGARTRASLKCFVCMRHLQETSRRRQGQIGVGPETRSPLRRREKAVSRETDQRLRRRDSQRRAARRIRQVQLVQRRQVRRLRGAAVEAARADGRRWVGAAAAAARRDKGTCTYDDRPGRGSKVPKKQTK